VSVPEINQVQPMPLIASNDGSSTSALVVKQNE